jgi:hypothetical protein
MSIGQRARKKSAEKANPERLAPTKLKAEWGARDEPGESRRFAKSSADFFKN